jgi:hypothetical protein
MEKKPTRAQKMAEQYADKLEKLDPTTKKPRVVKLSDTQTPEQKDCLKNAREKLATFKDLLG